MRWKKSWIYLPGSLGNRCGQNNLKGRKFLLGIQKRERQRQKDACSHFHELESFNLSYDRTKLGFVLIERSIMTWKCTHQAAL